MSIIGYFGEGLGLYSTVVGQIMYILCMLSLLVSIVFNVLGIIKLRKGYVKKAVLLALASVVYPFILLGCLFIFDAVDTMQMEKEMAEYNEQLYGEGWDSAPAIEGIPEWYQVSLNMYYAAVRDRWPADQLMDLGTTTMAEYYGDASLENLGFVMMDVNGDSVNELLIGTVAPVEEGGTAIFCMYSDPECPFLNLQSIEGEIYFLHPGEADGTCRAEIAGENMIGLFGTFEGDRVVDITYQEGTLDPANRLTLEMIPFSDYK